MSEIFQGQIVFFDTYISRWPRSVPRDRRTSGRCLSPRFLAGSFGSLPFTNGGGVIADIFSSDERGLVKGGLFSGAAFFRVHPHSRPVIIKP